MPGTKTVITITLDDTIPQEHLGDLRSILGDAVHSFYTARTQVEEYFEKAYGRSTVYQTDEEKAQKLAQIRTRVALAKLLHNPVLTLTMQNEEVG